MKIKEQRDASILKSKNNQMINSLIKVKIEIKNLFQVKRINMTKKNGIILEKKRSNGIKNT